MRAFVAVASELNYRRAAERLRIAQPAVTQQIKQLERALGVQLFDRTTRSVQLTLAGERFYGPWVEALEAVDRAIEAARMANPAEEGRLRVGFSGAYAQHLVPTFARAVRPRYPRVDLQLEGSVPSGIILNRIAAGQLRPGLRLRRCAALRHIEQGDLRRPARCPAAERSSPGGSE